MAQTHKVYKLDIDNEVKFGTTIIEACMDWSTTETATVVQSNSFGAVLNQAVYTDDGSAQVTITTKDPKQLEATEFRVGSKNTLTIYGIKRTEGNGVDDTDTITRIYASAVVSNISDTVSHGGESTATITFEVYDNGSGSLFATS